MELKGRLKRFGIQYLVGKGFLQVTPWAFERPLEGLCQGVGFVKGTRDKEGLFTVDFYWRYTNSPRNTPWAMDCHRRIGEFSSGGDEWYPIGDEQSYATVANIFSQEVVPFFNSHGSVAMVIHSFEDHPNGEQMLFGPDVGWRKFNIGFCYLWIGEKEKAAEYLRAVVEQHSKEKYDWVQERKQIAAEGLGRAIQEEERPAT
jgi:hypothetical protein